MSEIEIAKKYYKLLYSGNYDGVRSIASPNMKFSDPTMPMSKDSLQEFLSYMVEVMDGYDINLTFGREFVSNGYVVLNVRVRGSVPAEKVGGSGGEVTVDAEGVTALKIQDGRVVEHTDYFDYPTLNANIQSQL